MGIEDDILRIELRLTDIEDSLNTLHIKLNTILGQPKDRQDKKKAIKDTLQDNIMKSQQMQEDKRLDYEREHSF